MAGRDNRLLDVRRGGHSALTGGPGGMDGTGLQANH